MSPTNAGACCYDCSTWPGVLALIAVSNQPHFVIPEKNMAYRQSQIKADDVSAIKDHGFDKRSWHALREDGYSKELVPGLSYTGCHEVDP